MPQGTASRDTTSMMIPPFDQVGESLGGSTGMGIDALTRHTGMGDDPDR